MFFGPFFFFINLVVLSSTSTCWEQHIVIKQRNAIWGNGISEPCPRDNVGFEQCDWQFPVCDDPDDYRGTVAVGHPMTVAITVPSASSGHCGSEAERVQKHHTRWQYCMLTNCFTVDRAGQAGVTRPSENWAWSNRQEQVPSENCEIKLDLIQNKIKCIKLELELD